MSKTDAAKGPDNNKDFQRLEAEEKSVIAYLKAEGVEDLGGYSPIDCLVVRHKEALASLVLAREAFAAPVSMICAALTAAGVTLAEDADPILVAIDTIEEIVATRGKVGELADCILEHHEGAIENEGAIETAIKILSATPATDGQATPGEIAAIARAEAAEKRVAELELALAKATTSPGAAVPPAPARRVSNKPRKVGPKAAVVSRLELEGLIDDGVPFELVFSDGKNELIEFAPLTVVAGDLRSVGGRRALGPAPTIKGVVDRLIHGAALMRGDVQVSYCEFPRQVPIEAGQERKFDNAITF